VIFEVLTVVVARSHVFWPYDAVSLGNWFPSFRKIAVFSSSRLSS